MGLHEPPRKPVVDAQVLLSVRQRRRRLVGPVEQGVELVELRAQRRDACAGGSLADEIGREQEAIDWLAKSSNIDPKTPVRDWRLHPRFSQLSFLHLGVAKVLDSLGLGSLASELEITGALQTAEKLNLDGLLMLWHPSAGN
ncbi:MAG TPA: hypothetical protein VEH79_02895 [Gaiellaceae bacterium]|nr:hypothetical protein [Gaiellaceae bacterium]